VSFFRRTLSNPVFSEQTILKTDIGQFSETRSFLAKTGEVPINTRAISKYKLVFLAVVGNILEFYDFTLFTVFYVVISTTFISSNNSFSQLMATLGIFAAGFLMRPLGGLYFGYIGDKYGRKKALSASLLGMAFSTFCIGILPGVDMIGIFALILLIFCRLIQGFCIGGEGPRAAIFCLEHLHEIKPGFISSIIAASNIFGGFLAIVTGLIVKCFFDYDELIWRLMFICGGLIGLIGAYIRTHFYETPIFLAIKEQNQIEPNPAYKLFKSYKLEIIALMFLGGLIIALSCIILAYIQVFLISFRGVTEIHALIFMSIGALLYTSFLPFLGMLSDHFGFKTVIITAAFCIVGFSYPAFYLLASNSYLWNFVGILILTIMAASIYGPSYQFMLSVFPVKQRYSGIAFSFNLGAALLGGTAPAILTFLVKNYEHPGAASIYPIILSISFLAFARRFIIKK
jgi:MHS family proline/betaine transporter-like MFS transporter